MIFDKRELERLGIHPEPDEFVLVVDAARYASSGSDGDFEFEIGMFEDGIFHAVSDMDVVLNHRYPNSAYETVAGRFGRKLCRCGCPFVLKRDLLKKQLYFFLHSGFRVQGADAVVCALDFEPMDSPDSLMYGFSVKAFPPGMYGGDGGDVSFTLLSGQGTGAWRMTEYGFRSSSDSRFDHVLFDAGRCRRYTGSSGCVCLEPAEHLKPPAFAMDMGLLFV